nr:hypothetical protein [Tanacetum cinerariifolium]
MSEFGDSSCHENTKRRMVTPEDEDSYPWEELKSSDVDVCRTFLMFYIVEDPIWKKISCELEEPICSPSGALYTTDYCCSNGSLVDKIICDLNKAPDSPRLHTFSSNQRHCFQCKDMLGDGEFYQRCTCMRCASGLSKGLCLICGNNQKILNDSPSISENSSQSPPHINHHCCYECGDPLDGIFCKRCTCISCRKGAHIGYNCPPKVPDYIIVITPKEIDNSLSMGDEHLDTIPTIESDEFIKYSVKNLVPNPSESKGEHECDVPACDNFTTFSNLLLDVDDDFSSSDDESFSDEDISKKIYSNPLFDKESISKKINPHHFNVESDLIESLLNQDSLIISSSSKIDYLLDEFADELILLKSIPPGIDKTDCDTEEEIRLIEKLLYDNSFPRPLEEINSKNSDAIIKSFTPSPIPIEYSDPFMEEIDLFLASDGSTPSGIDNDYSDSEGDNLFLERLLHDDHIPLPDILDFSNVV